MCMCMCSDMWMPLLSCVCVCVIVCVFVLVLVVALFVSLILSITLRIRRRIRISLICRTGISCSMFITSHSQRIIIVISMRDVINRRVSVTHRIRLILSHNVSIHITFVTNISLVTNHRYQCESS